MSTQLVPPPTTPRRLPGLACLACARSALVRTRCLSPATFSSALLPPTLRTSLSHGAWTWRGGSSGTTSRLCRVAGRRQAGETAEGVRGRRRGGGVDAHDAAAAVTAAGREDVEVV